MTSSTIFIIAELLNIGAPAEFGKIAIIALLVSFYSAYQPQQANGLSTKANELAGGSNKTSAEALKVANDGATASVGVAEARLSGDRSFFAPIEIEPEVPKDRIQVRVAG